MTDTSGAHKSSCRQTRLGLEDSPGAPQVAVGHLLVHAAQAAVEQIRPGKAQAAAGQTPPGTEHTAVL